MTFHNQYADKIVLHWYDEKGRRMHKGKRKEYKKNYSRKYCRAFDIESFMLDIHDETSPMIG